MTPVMLIDELAAELEDVFKDYTYKNAHGERVPINIYKHALPVTPVRDIDDYYEGDDESDDSKYIPYIIVRLNSGKDEGTRDSANTVKLVMIIGVWDDSLDVQGYKEVLNIIHKIYERFQTEPNLNGRAVYDGQFNWLLQEDDYYPYYFGACTLNFQIAAIRREDPFV